MGGRSASNALACIFPDSNLIENLWDLQSTRIEACQPELRNLINLRAAVHEVRITIPQQSINTPVSCMRCHFQAVIDSRGHMT